MALPMDLIVIRHGQSEANTKQKDPRGNTPNDGRDNLTRLTQTGIAQAKAAGAWLRGNGLSRFDRYYTSPYIRARQTATLLALDGAWTIDNRWRERNCGAASQGINGQQQHKWYWRPGGGEALGTEVRQRFESILQTLRQEASDRRVIAATHGKFMTVVRFVMERMSAEEWLQRDRQELIENCQILHYSRRSPKTGAVASEIRWMRSVCPWDSSCSWYEGQWIELRQCTLSDAELFETVNGLVRRHYGEDG
jgi:broad specificity phosphatase PhoE